MKVSKLRWDSFFFDANVYELDLTGSYSHYNIDQVERFIPIDTDIAYVLSQHEINEKTTSPETKYFASLRSETCLFRKKLDRSFHFDNKNIRRYDQVDDLNKIIDLAYISGTQSRFNLDPFFEEHKFKEMYRLWVEKSIKGEFGDGLNVYTEDSHVKGIVTYGSFHDTASIGLIAVDPRAWGQGIGFNLVGSFEEYYRFSKEINFLQIKTQGDNIPAQNLYQKCGYKMEERIIVTHLLAKKHFNDKFQ